MGDRQQLRHPLLLLLCVLCSTLWWSGRVEGCTEQERRALLQLRDSFYYPASPNLSEWSSWVGNDCCRWEGVSCQSDPPHRVVNIYLNSKRKEGLGGWAVNGSLFVPFEELQGLQLESNQISGWLEPKGMLGLKNLRSVDFSENLLTDESVSWMFSLPSLADVDLSYNKLRSSSILKGFCALKNLTSLNLDQNMIEGTIDPCISTMTALQDLILQRNRFSGQIPPLGKMSSLRNILLANNRLSGVLYFSSLAELTNFNGISVGGNPRLEIETEHPSWAPSFQLGGLILSGCTLNRRSGGRIPSFLSTQKNMFTLALSRTGIQGEIPPWMFDNVQEYLLLDGNRLSGHLPQLHGNRTRGLSLLDLSENNLTGPMPQNMSSLLPELYHLNLSRNAFHGDMASFGQLGYLGVLDLSHNHLTGEIPIGLTGNGSEISHLKLSHNYLEGSMLPQGSNMKLLKYLILENNSFSGGISPDLSNSPNLIILNVRGNHLSGAIPGELFALPDLAAVLLARNRFQGPIPSQFCRMQGLRMLDLSANSFSGAIPGCLSNVTSWRKSSKALINQNFYFREWVSVEFWSKGKLQTLEDEELSWFTGIDLSMNQLSGAIPVEVGAMAALRSLSLSRNHVSGAIPASFQALERMQSLDLSYNRLSGIIPPEIAPLRNLSYFCVAYNTLSGVIPFGHDSKFSRRCFEGNPGLCGHPLGRIC
uniref:LRR receptor-like serine/threonine-protein kinase ERECTA n=1 Tax=Anthurium amnicola TaxID=1678845 RepID=A0A1D1Z9E0_9ARAE